MDDKRQIEQLKELLDLTEAIVRTKDEQLKLRKEQVELLKEHVTALQEITNKVKE